MWLIRYFLWFWSGSKWVVDAWSYDRGCLESHRSGLRKRGLCTCMEARYPTIKPVVQESKP
jgi:hypothetical protein